MGDAAGVGPELMLRLLADPPIEPACRLVILADWNVLRECGSRLNWPLPDCPVISLDQFSRKSQPLHDGSVVIVDDPQIDLGTFEVGKVNRQCGRLAFRLIQAAIDAVLANQVAGVATGPINKLALRAAGLDYPGHTEIFAERAAQGQPWCMMQYSPTITCSFVTTHCGYADVPGLLSVERIFDTILLTDQAVRRIRGRAPRLLVCGLNPHAGEDGLFGNAEEERFIQPAVEMARNRGIEVEGPLPPDTVFIPQRLAETDAVVCMYHDQGHIPIKALAFDSAVNTTLGLSIIRTSVDHGTAYDIAWQGIAKPDSLYAAIRLACRLALRSG